MEFDQGISWRNLEERLARTDNPRHRQMLQTVIDHAKAEANGDVDGLMATLCDDPQYHFWSGGNDWGPKGKEAVRAYYEDFVASGAGFFESYKTRIVVDDDNVVTESVMRQLVPGRVAQQRGYTIPDVDAHLRRHRARRDLLAVRRVVHADGGRLLRQQRSARPHPGTRQRAPRRICGDAGSDRVRRATRS